MKPKETQPNAHIRRYWESLDPRCVACLSTHDVVIHHILAPMPQKLRRRDHRFVVKLCPACHNMGTDSVHLLGSESRFMEVRGVDLVGIALDNLEQYDG